MESKNNNSKTSKYVQVTKATVAALHGYVEKIDLGLKRAEKEYANLKQEVETYLETMQQDDYHRKSQRDRIFSETSNRLFNELDTINEFYQNIKDLFTSVASLGVLEQNTVKRFDEFLWRIGTLHSTHLKISFNCLNIIVDNHDKNTCLLPPQENSKAKKNSDDGRPL